MYTLWILTLNYWNFSFDHLQKNVVHPKIIGGIFAWTLVEY